MNKKILAVGVLALLALTGCAAAEEPLEERMSVLLEATSGASTPAVIHEMYQDSGMYESIASDMAGICERDGYIDAYASEIEAVSPDLAAAVISTYDALCTN